MQQNKNKKKKYPDSLHGYTGNLLMVVSFLEE